MVLHFHLHSKCDSDLCRHCTDVETEALENENLSQLVETGRLLMVVSLPTLWSRKRVKERSRPWRAAQRKNWKERSNLQSASRGPEEVWGPALEKMTSFMAGTMGGGSQSKDQQGTLPCWRQVQDL